MKHFLQSYFSFTRTEKNGFIALCTVLIVLIIVRVTMSLWVHAPVDIENERKLAAAWEIYKRAQPAQLEASVPQKVKDFQDASDEQTSVLPDTINLNTADSATLVRLKGIGPATAHKIILRRTTKGPFTNMEQLSETGRFSEATLQLLGKHISFKVAPKR